MKKRNIRSIKELVHRKLIDAKDQNALEAVSDIYSFAISDEMINLIDQKNSAHDPIALQFIPQIKELSTAPYERADPIGDHAHSPVKGIVHRYQDRCLLIPLHICPVYCRFCFRRNVVGQQEGTLTPSEWENAFQYIENHPEIWEVILTGGDPLILKPSQIKSIIQRLNAIKHVSIIRFHTRIPLVEPHRIDEDMLQALSSDKPIYIAIHANHAKEFTEAGRIALKKLRQQDIALVSQTTLLKGINDHIDTLSELMRTFVKHRIKPYYLHHPDPAKGTSHFEVSIEAGQALMKALRGRFSGLCQPTYVLDIPGGFGKMPIGPNYLTNPQSEPTQYVIEDYQNEFHEYPSTIQSKPL